jgi:hypothetical protein
MQTEKRDMQEVRQDEQDKQDGLPRRGESPNGETVILKPILSSILSILFILSKFRSVTESFRIRLCSVLLLLAPCLVSAEDARLPYHELFRLQKAQMALSRAHTNLALALEMHSTQPGVEFSEITAFIDAKSGKVPVPIGTNGAFSVPVSNDLLVEDPWILVNQPRGTMELNWHAGLAQALASQLTNAVHYAPLMRAVRECDEVQESMRQFFPNSPRLTAVGLRLTFRAESFAPAAIIHAKGGDRKLPANILGELIIPIDGDLMEEDPVMTLTESPIAVEIVTKKKEDGP